MPRRTEPGDSDWLAERMELEVPSGANWKRIGTAKLGNRDERHRLAAIGPELAVSGSDSAVPLFQDPAKAREF